MRQELTGYRERLNKALKSGPNPMSVRALARKMQSRFPDLRGTSYSGLRLYVYGGRDEVAAPRHEVLRAIAEVLNVRPQWLLFDDGPMTEEEAAHLARTNELAKEALAETPNAERRAARDEDVPRARAKRLIQEAIVDLSGERPRSSEQIPYWAEGLVEVFRRLLESDLSSLALDEEGAEHDGLADVAAAVRGPIDAFEIDFEEMRDWPGHALADYITAITPALLALVAERRRQKELERRVLAKLDA